MSETQNLGLPYIDAGQAQKHVTHNEALRVLDALVQLAVQDRDLTAPPSTPIEGQRWIVKTGATGAWAGRANQVAAWQDGAWQFSAPVAGWIAYVIDEGILAVWDGSAWSAVAAGEGGGGGDPTELQNLSLLGIGTTADTTNPLCVNLNNVLWTAKTIAEGGDGTLRYKLSKEDSAKTLSFIFQDAFSARAEIGLTGDDDFHFKVSPDGTAWLEAIKIDHSTGKVSFPSGGAREVLTANRTYYVRTDGSDSNNGLSNTSGGAFLTIQKAIDTVAALDISIYTVTIQLGNSGTWTGFVSVNAPWIGTGNVVLAGDATTPSNTVISTTSVPGQSAITVRNGGRLQVKNFKVQTSTGGSCIQADNGVVKNLGGINFGAAAFAHWAAANNGFIYADYGTAPYAISGGSLAGHFYASLGGTYYIRATTITLTGTPAFTTAFASFDNTSKGFLDSLTFSGSATGSRYSSQSNSVINTFGAGANYFPGNSAGTTASGGIYL